MISSLLKVIQAKTVQIYWVAYSHSALRYWCKNPKRYKTKNLNMLYIMFILNVKINNLHNIITLLYGQCKPPPLRYSQVAAVAAAAERRQLERREESTLELRSTSCHSISVFIDTNIINICTSLTMLFFRESDLL